MSSPFALKFLGKKPFTKKTVNPEAGGKDYEAMGDAARKREQKLSAETGGVDYEAKLKVQKKMSPLNGAYSSGAGGSVYVSTAGAFQNLQDKISAGIQTNIAESKSKEIDKEFSKWQKLNPDSTRDTPEYQAEYVRLYGPMKPTYGIQN
jgi:hypothetical protein